MLLRLALLFSAEKRANKEVPPRDCASGQGPVHLVCDRSTAALSISRGILKGSPGSPLKGRRAFVEDEDVRKGPKEWV